MGIDAFIESEEGNAKAELADPDGLILQLAASLEPPTSFCLRFIDPYGDTTFNQIQLPVLIEELQLAIDNSSDPLVKSHGEALLKLAQKAYSEVHTYLKFYGD